MRCVTLLSDLGLHDPAVGMAKGILMQHLAADTELVDLSHSVEPFLTEQAAYLLRSSYRHFPPGTCHLVLFNVFAERGARLIHCTHEGHHFLAPDNGIIPLALRKLPAAVCCYEAAHPAHLHQWVQSLGRYTALLGTKRFDPADFQPCALKELVQPPLPTPDSRSIDCHVIHIDRFENVVLDITREQFDTAAAGRPFRIRFMRNDEITTISTNYYEVPQGEKLCRFNSAGHLEICINGGKAASLFGFRLHREQNLMYRAIKILFG